MLQLVSESRLHLEQLSGNVAFAVWRLRDGTAGPVAEPTESQTRFILDRCQEIPQAENVGAVFAEDFSRPHITRDGRVEPPPADASPFDTICHVRADGSEYWLDRELMRFLDYNEWRNFCRVIDEARRVADIAAVHGQFVDVNKMVKIGSGAMREVADVKVTRYGAYMITMSGDGSKRGVALGRTYFAIKAREAGIAATLNLSDPIAALEAAHARTGQAIEIAKAERARADTAEGDNRALHARGKSGPRLPAAMSRTDS